MGSSSQSWSTDGRTAPTTPLNAAPARRSLRAYATEQRWVRFALLAVVLVVPRAVTEVVLSRTAAPSAAPWMSTAPIGMTTAEAQWPTPTRPATGQRLAHPAPAPASGGPHTFMALQPGSDDPIAYDPCRPIHYVVNERTAPVGAEFLVQQAVADVEDATGLTFVYDGTTDEAPSADRSPFQPERYGDRWAPVLIAWTDPAEVADLAGGFVGLGGSTPVMTAPQGPAVYVSGVVALDGPQVAGMQRAYSTYPQGVIVHELAHVLGLGHVEDPSQLMNAEASTRKLGAGDLTGLARLGAGPCVEQL